FDQFATVYEHRIEVDAAVRQAAGERVTRARGRQCLEAHIGQQLRRADVPWIGDDECAGTVVQPSEFFRLVHEFLRWLVASVQVKSRRVCPQRSTVGPATSY